ncbi:Hsp70 family protein [Dactylosporangium sp. NPDC049140]|uniref:Hsp70 family protein n=1 Tax=Dactylosporangium sp. NPDC049140 TaxID=3155647 RepID=UPI0033FF3A1F
MTNHRPQTQPPQRARRFPRHARPRVAAAIDFGTHGSGFAWAFTSEEQRPIAERRLTFHMEWIDQPAPYVKTRSALLVDGGGAILDWGFAAARRYKLESRGGAAIALEHGFKMRLPDGDPAAVELVTGYLQELYRYAVERITGEAQVREEEIRWCVTVPAIWRDRERHLMRRAAVAAGMPDDVRRLLIAVEPEVATQYCQGHLQLATADDEPDEAGDWSMLVIDAGGGTVDLSSFRIDDRGSLTELGHASGGPHGGTFVDRAFLVNVLAKRIGGDLLQRLQVDLPAAVLEILDNWERDKRFFDPSRGAPFNLPLPVKLYQLLSQEGRLSRFAASQQGIEEPIVLSNAEVKAAFDEVVEPILALVDEHLVRVAGQLDHVFLVGGFAQSPYLRSRLTQHLAGRAAVQVPPNPASAVLAGAVHFALDPDVVIARKSPRTYGIATNLPFEDAVDPPDRLLPGNGNGQRLCMDRFEAIVQRDDLLPVDTERKITLFPVSDTETELELVMLGAEAAGVPRYADEPQVHVLGTVNVPIGPANGRAAADRGVVLTLAFGGTEIAVTAVDATSGHTLQHRITFASMGRGGA